MHVVSVMNYKGGVGKTTLTANLAAQTAKEGHRVLMIDLDPQANLTLSFYTTDEWQDDLRETRTIKRWFDSDLPGQDVPLAEMILTPPRVNEILREESGRLDLIASHLGLIDVDLKLGAFMSSGYGPEGTARKFLQVHDSLAHALRTPAFEDYDLILIDCPPNFGLVTRTALVASDNVLVPAKPDYLSTLGIAYMIGSLQQLIRDFNGYANQHSHNGGGRKNIAPRIAGIAFTMTQIQNGKPIIAQRNQIEQIRAEGKARVLASTVRNNPKFFSEAGESGIPAILRGAESDPLTMELRALTEEFLAALGERGQQQ